MAIVTLVLYKLPVRLDCTAGYCHTCIVQQAARQVRLYFWLLSLLFCTSCQLGQIVLLLTIVTLLMYNNLPVREDCTAGYCHSCIVHAASQVRLYCWLLSLLYCTTSCQLGKIVLLAIVTLVLYNKLPVRLDCTSGYCHSCFVQATSQVRFYCWLLSHLYCTTSCQLGQIVLLSIVPLVLYKLPIRLYCTSGYCPSFLYKVAVR